MKATFYRGFSLVILAGLLAASGCGGRSSGGAEAQPAPPGANSTLKISNITSRTVVVVDGQTAPAASGTLTLQVAAGTHAVTVSRSGYTVTNAADLQQVPAAVGTTVEKAVTFTRDAAPLPAGWTAAARPVIAQAIEAETQSATGTADITAAQ